MRDWKDGELVYIHDLLESCGNTSVPKTAIVSYLTTQHVSALNDGQFAIATALLAAMVCVRKGNWAGARHIIREAINV